MSTHPEGAHGALRRAREWTVRSWPLWEMPRRLVAAVLVVEATALGLVVAVATRTPLPDGTQVLHTALLAGLGLLHTEAAIGVERIRRRATAGGSHANLSSVWTFAGALVLPPVCAAAVAVVVHLHVWARTGRPRVPLYRGAYSTATIVLACLAAAGVVALLGRGLSAAGLPGIVLALGVYTTINNGLVAGAVAMSAPQPDLARVLGDWDDNLLEVATLSLGALTAVAVLVNPWLVLLALPPLLVLHRAVLVKHLEEAASTDGKTGLLNAAAWHARAEQVLRRGGRRQGPGAVLVLDLDHFKTVNDTHGHLAGDRVLAAVAGALRGEVREQDLVGRFGGEEFVVMLGGAGPAEFEAVAERIRRRVADLRVEMPTPDGPLTVSGLTVSIGGALSPDEGADLRTLLQIADTALYAAKRGGRNAVRMGVPVPAPPPVVPLHPIGRPPDPT
ncbi:GGDEF domain-containing protein [Pseudonocardia kunmingensis]|uniref:Diguanylate cyclase (GGDEF)-like protein n=1 Tax=Pseudonocardia kunmingensis TaxID=630975 RepID=A0A543DXD9_9PSEU|nr:GGDEF domain-containing protein [Pseudonocardia kunmingensis]TQM13976.1 diguanylate cyclase (GGDEF)-like protein [Pseudonocardia kunmingensis]